MLKWLKTNVYIAGWIGAAAGAISVLKNVKAILSLAAAVWLIALFPRIKRTAKHATIMLVVWLMVGLGIVLARLTIPQDATKDMLKTLVLVVFVYFVLQSIQNGLKAESQA